MAVFNIKVADLIIKVDENASNIGIFNDYLVDNDLKADINVLSDTKDKEYIDVHNKLAEKLPLFNGLLMHGAAISYKNKAYIFIAPSGTGKTTHIKLWEKHLSDLKIINGDKPIVRKENDKYYVYGSPWSGKEGYNTNIKVPLAAIIILKRANIDEIKQIDPKSYLNDVMKQIYLPKDQNSLNLTINLINSLFTDIKVYELGCTKLDSAFYTCYKGLIED